MLGKLMKYEWKSLYKMECILLSVITAFTVFGVIVLHTPAVEMLFSDDFDVPDSMAALFALSVVGSAVMYVVVLVASTYGNLIYQGVHFYKTMYSDEGYLTNTLPVSAHELLLSKVIINALWTIIISATVVVSVFAVVFSFVNAIEPEAITFESFGEAMEEFVYLMDSDSVFSLVHMWIIIILAFVGSPIASVCILFGALTIGQLFRKGRVIIGIVAYFLLNMITQIITSIVQTFGMITVIGLSEVEDVSYDVTQFFSQDIGIIMMLIMGVVLYFLSHHIITRKLNMV